MATEQKLMTAEELFDMPDDGMDHELVRGKLRTMPPPGFRHEETALHVGIKFGVFIEQHELGRFVGGPGFRIENDPDTVRAPDFAFIAAGRVPEGESPAGYLDFAPDLLVEVVSPSDSASEVQEKVEQWLAAGARMVLVLYPARRSMALYRSPTDVRLLGPEDVFDGADVLPGFTCRVADLFPG
jgi:Uma2 family endonuclease